MSEPITFYYRFKRLNFWLVLNLIVTYFLICCTMHYSFCWYWIESYIIAGTILISWGLWIYKHFTKQTLAVITDDAIKIDHCQPLLWKNIISAEERFVRCGFKNMKVIILNTKKDMEYQYNFLQKHNGGFTPFSLPLYPVVTKEDAEKFKKIIATKIKYTSLPDNK